MVKKIKNITFHVCNLKKSTFFYENILGLKKTGEWHNYVIFDLGGVEFALEPGGKKGRKEDAPTIFLAVDDVDIEYERLKEKGVKFLTEPMDQYWGGRTSTFLDPEENMFVLVSPIKKQD